jgi:hypothetical protein
VGGRGPKGSEHHERPRGAHRPLDAVTSGIEHGGEQRLAVVGAQESRGLDVPQSFDQRGRGVLGAEQVEVAPAGGGDEADAPATVVGITAPGFLGATLARDGKPAASGERIWGTAASVTASILNGAHIVRVHDVAEMKQIALVTDCLANISK